MEQIAAIKSVSMDMWPAYIRATRDAIPDADEKIAFDKFHVARYLSEAFDKVRRVEHRALLAEGRTDLVRSKYQWLRNANNMSHKQWREFKDLRESTLRTARTWAIKAWKRWLSWAVRCRLGPVKKVAQTVKKHLWDIINAIVMKVDNVAQKVSTTQSK